MRIVILTQYYAPEIGAPQVRLAALAAMLKRRGHEVEVVTAMPNHLEGKVFAGYSGRMFYNEVIDGIPVHRTYVYAATGTGLRRVFNYLSFAMSCIFGLLRCRRPEVIFVESPPLFLSVPAWMASRLFGSKLIFNVADLWPDSVRELGVISSGPLLSFAEKLETWSYRRADIVNAATRSIASTLQEKKAVPAHKIRFLPNGVDIDAFQPEIPHERLRAELDLDDLPVLLFAGTHGIAQGLESIVDAAPMLEGIANIVFIGAGPRKAAAFERARALGVKNVRFVPSCAPSQMSGYLALASAAIVPLVRSHLMSGARPSKMFPALACGVPVLYCGEGEGAALIEEAGVGVVVEPQNARAFADAAMALLSDPERRASMSRRARALAVEKYSWQAIVDEWLASLALGMAEA